MERYNGNYSNYLGWVGKAARWELAVLFTMLVMALILTPIALIYQKRYQVGVAVAALSSLAFLFYRAVNG
jgi:hypothetical protein